MATVTVAPDPNADPVYPIDAITKAIQEYHANRPPAPTAPRSSFLDRLAAGLQNVQAPAGAGFGATALASAARGFAAPRVAARTAEQEKLLADYEDKKALEHEMLGARIEGLKTQFTTAADIAKFRRTTAAKNDDHTVTPEEAKAFPRLKAFEGKPISRSRFEEITTAAPKETPIVAIETPTGPKYVRESEALGQPPAKGSREGNRAPSAGERDQMTTDMSLLSQIGDIRSTFKPEYVGPAAGRVGAVAGAVGMGMQSREESKFRGRVAALRNQVLKARSGGAVTEGEAQRLLEELPITIDPSENFLSKLSSFEQIVRNIAQSRRDILSGTGVDVSKIPALPPSSVVTAAPKPGGWFEANAPR